MCNLLTIFIPTFNRNHELKRLLDSLVLQTNNNFKVLVVDDGSTDNTHSLIKEYISKLSLNYIWKKNEGKIRTVKYALEFIDTEFFFNLDSDAWLKKDAVEVILNDLECYSRDKEFGGLYYTIEDQGGNIIGRPFKQDYLKSDFQKALDYDNVSGDKAVITKTILLKQVGIPIFEDEIFLTESVYQNRIALLSYCVCRNRSIMIVEYHEDGLTSNIPNYWITCPKGYYLFFLERINDHKLPYFKYITSIMALIVFTRRTDKNLVLTLKSLNKVMSKVLCILLYPFGVLFDVLQKNKVNLPIS